MGAESRKWHNKVVFWTIIIVAIGILSLTIITDICLIKKNCSLKSIEQVTGTTDEKNTDINYQLFSTDSLTTINKNETIPQLTKKDDLNHNVVPQSATNSLTRLNKEPVQQSNDLERVVVYLTLAVNTVNNVLSGGAIALGILTLFLGLVGLFGFNTLKEDIDNKTKVFADKFNERITLAENNVVKLQNDTQDKTESIEKKFGDFMNQYESLVKSLNAQERYTNKSIETLYEAIYMFINNPGPNGSGMGLTTDPNGGPSGDVGSASLASQIILNKLYHELQILKLYRCSLNINDEDAKLIKHGKRTALEYLKTEGTLDDLLDLDHVAEYELDDDIISRIHEVKGFIKSRYYL